MKRKLVLFAVLLIILVASMGTIVYLTKNTEDPSSEGDPVYAVSYTREDIESVSITNEKDSYSFAVADNEIGYYCDKVEDLPQLLSNYISIIDSVCSIEANSAYPDSDLSRYGLDDPQAAAEVTLKSGEKYTVLVGSRAPTENYVYFSVSTDPRTVYTARLSKFSPLLANAYSLVNRLLAPKTESSRPGNDETDTAHSIEFTNRDGELFHLDQLSSSYKDGAGNSYRYHQTYPRDMYVQASRVQDVFSRVMQFCASSVYKNHPTAEDIASCGLDEPLTELTLGYNDEYATVRLALAPNGDYYAMKDGVDVIWIVADYLVTWLDADEKTFRSSYVMAPPMDTIKGVTVMFPDPENDSNVAKGDTYSIVINEDGTGTINNKTVNSGDLARLYTLLCSVNSENETSAEGGDIVVRIEFAPAEGGARILDLRQGGSRTLIIYTDDIIPAGLSIRESYADTLHEACRAVENGEAFSTNW